MDKDFCLTKWNDEERKQMPNISDFIQRIEKATKLRKANKQSYWLTKQHQLRMDQVNRVKQANDPHASIEADAEHASEENHKKRQSESQSKMSSKKRDSVARKGKDDASKIKDVMP